MWQVSDRFLTAIRQSGVKMVTVVDILDRGDPVDGYTGLQVESGSVTRDRMAEIYAQATVTFALPDLAPLTPESPLTPAGFEARVWRGVEYSDGTQELVPLITGPIQDSSVDDDLRTTIEVADRSQWLIDARLLADAEVASGSDPATTIETVVEQIIDWDIGFDVDSVPFETTPRLIFEERTSRWEIVTMLVDGIGAWARFNGMGDLAASPEPDLSITDPVWTVNEENDTEPGVLISASYTWSRRPVFPGILAVGRNIEFSVDYRAFVLDADVASPTYYYGRFSDKPGFIESEAINSTAAATAMATAELNRSKGLARSLDFSAVPNAALEPADVVLIQREAMGLDLAVVVDALTIGLGPDEAMTGSVRARQETETEVS